MNGRFLSVEFGIKGIKSGQKRVRPTGTAGTEPTEKRIQSDQIRGDGVDQNSGMEPFGTKASVLNAKTDGLREEEVSTARVDLRFRIFFQNPAHVGKADSSSLSLAGITGFKQGICQ